MQNNSKMIDKYVDELVKSHTKVPSTVSIAVPKYLLERINRLRKQHKTKKEPQFMCIQRIVQFYEDNNHENI